MSSRISKFQYKSNRLTQLRGFVYTVDYKSLAVASKVLNLAISTISEQISSLERDLKIDLFQKNGRNMILTEIGKDFYHEVSQYVYQIDSLFENFLEKRNQKYLNTIKIASHFVPISYILPNTFKQIKQSYSDLKIYYHNISQSEAINRIIKNELDIAIYPCEDSTIFPNSISTVELCKYEICMVMPKNHILNTQNNVTIADIVEQPLLYEDIKLMSSSFLSKIFYNQKNLNNNFEFENINWDIMYTLCKNGFGIAGFDKIFCQNRKLQDDGLVTKSISHLLPKMSYFLITKNTKYYKPAMKDLILYLQEAFGFYDL